MIPAPVALVYRHVLVSDSFSYSLKFRGGDQSRKKRQISTPLSTKSTSGLIFVTPALLRVAHVTTSIDG